MIFSQNIYRSFIQRNKAQVALAFSLHLVSNICAILIPLLIGKYYELVFDLNSTRSMIWSSLTSKGVNTIDGFFQLFTILIIVKIALTFAAKYVNGLIGEKLSYQLRNDLFAAQLNIPISVYKERGIGRYLLRFSGDLQSIHQYFTKGFILFAADTLLLIIAIALLHSFSPTLSYLVTISFIVGFIVLNILNHIMYGKIMVHRNKKSNLLAFVNRSLMEFSSLIALNKQSIKTKKFNKYASKILVAGKQYQLIASLFSACVLGLSYVMLLTALYAGTIIQSQQLQGSTLLITIVLIITLLPSIRRIFRVRMVWQKGKVSVEKIQNIFDLQKTYSDVNEIDPTEQPIIIEDYRIDQSSGISTLYLDNPQKAMDDFIFPNEADKNKKPISSKHWLRQIAFVDSRYGLLGRTVFEAVSYSRKAEKRMQCQQMLSILQQGLSHQDRLHIDDKIGENGKNLSAEQIKICLICRALLTNKPIMICRDLFKNLSQRSSENLAAILEKRADRCLVLLLHEKQPDKKNNLLSAYRATAATSAN